ncbi:hypothetical protein AVEN_245336-1 [Araneus ventricosus]|uniref:Uncharacterized protein n=2 Tax=Araneus ventricosus TaxID=182803 RepID=A0A4Y2VKY5_ARAVE|nr:hypothetical protein AVEN_245336-1 [Araneus ventricosus]
MKAPSPHIVLPFKHYYGKTSRMTRVISIFNISAADLNPCELRNVWFQHDGAPVRKTSSVKQYLVEEFGEQRIGYGDFQEWPPRSPDPTPMDFSCGDTSNSKCM